MPLIQTDSQHYSDIADAIRDMSGNEETFYPSEMAAGVRSIPQTIAIQPIIYSLEEREVGVWTDWKPLYARTWVSSFAYDSQSRSYSADVANLDFSNFDKVVYSSVQMVNSTVSTTIPYYSVGNDQVYYWYSKTDNKIYIRANTDRTSYNAHTTLYYTKTTDTPGSGTWTPSGVPAVHYDGTEKVIGTWFGETLYEKTQIGGITLNGTNWQDTTITGVDKVASVFGVILRDNEPIALGDFNGSLITSWICRNNTIKINVQKNTSGDNISFGYITVRYTKTTD